MHSNLNMEFYYETTQGDYTSICHGIITSVY